MEDDNYILSVIIPVYNGAKTIRETLDSVLIQECKSIEIIIVDDGSTDHSQEICLQYCKTNERIKYYYKDNSGVSETRNLGISYANGEYISFLDADDIWDKHYIDKKLEQKLREKRADIFVFSSCFADMEMNVQEEVLVKSEIISGGYKAVDKYYHSFCSFIFCRELLNEYNIRFINALKYGEDEVFRSHCLFVAKKIEAENKRSFYYRNNPKSATKMNRNNKQYAIQKLEAYFYMKEIFQKSCEEGGNETIKSTCAITYFATAIKLLSQTGYGYFKLRRLCEKENVGLIIANNGKNYNLYCETEDVLIEYHRNPLLFYIKRRVYGMLYYTAVDFKHLLMKKGLLR